MTTPLLPRIKMDSAGAGSGRDYLRRLPSPEFGQAPILLCDRSPFGAIDTATLDAEVFVIPDQS
jgi:hypothetical protein